MNRRHRHRLGATAAAALIALTLGACNAGETTADPTGTPTASETSTSPSTSPTPETPEEEVEAVLTQYLDYYEKDLKAGDVKLERLEPVITQKMAMQHQRSVATYADAGIEITGNYSYTYSGTKITGNKAIVRACQDRSGLDARLPSGKPVKYQAEDGTTLPNPVEYTYHFVQQDGEWLVDSSGWRGEKAPAC